MSPTPSIFQQARTKKGSLIPKVAFALCSTQKIHAANTFLSQVIEKGVCYNNISYICAGYSSVSTFQEPC